MYHGDPAAEGMRAAHLDRVFNAIQEHYPEAERDPMTGAAYIMGANCYYIMGDTEESGYLHVEVYAGNDLLATVRADGDRCDYETQARNLSMILNGAMA